MLPQVTVLLWRSSSGEAKAEVARTATKAAKENFMTGKKAEESLVWTLFAPAVL